MTPSSDTNTHSSSNTTQLIIPTKLAMFFLQNSIMFSILITLLLLLLPINPTFSQQSYDTSSCTAESEVPGSNYICTAETYPCQTFLVYRAQASFRSISSISSLFNVTTTHLLEINKMTEPQANNLTLGREILIPVNCSCPDMFSEANVEHNVSTLVSFDVVACEVFEGLAKAQSIEDKNSRLGGDTSDYLMVKVPIRCACPTADQRAGGVDFLVTYPVVENDNTELIARKFELAEMMIWKANKLPPTPTIYPGTTLLVPVRDNPVVNWEIGFSSPTPIPVIPVNNVTQKTRSRLMELLLIGLGAAAAACLLTAVAYFSISLRNRLHLLRFQPLTGSSSSSSVLTNLSPAFLDGMLKLKQSLASFSLAELIIATQGFSEASKIGTTVFRGEFGGSSTVIKKMASKEEARRVLYILTKVNHVNIVKVEGCCLDPEPYLILEFAEQGSLRECLVNKKVAGQFTWDRRIRIAFDLAVVLHYIHYCTKPCFVHGNLKSRHVLVTKDWRAKISGFRFAKAVILEKEEKKDSNQNEFAVEEGNKDVPESFKVDVFALGMILLELISGKEMGWDDKMLKDFMSFEETPGWCRKLESLIDPALEGKFHFGQAMFLLSLAWACLHQIPHQRPSMNDVLKAVSKLL